MVTKLACLDLVFNSETCVSAKVVWINFHCCHVASKTIVSFSSFNFSMHQHMMVMCMLEGEEVMSQLNLWSSKSMNDIMLFGVGCPDLFFVVELCNLIFLVKSRTFKYLFIVYCKIFLGSSQSFPCISNPN